MRCHVSPARLVGSASAPAACGSRHRGRRRSLVDSLGACCAAASSASAQRAPVPRHDRLWRPGIHEELQPVHRHRPSERSVRQGRDLRAPDRSRRVGGKPTVPWLAQSWKWTNGNKTLTLNLAKGVKWSDGKPLTSADVVYSLNAGKQSKHDGPDRLHAARTRTSRRSRRRARTRSSITLKTPDSQFIAATLNAQFVVPQHIWSKVADPATFTNPNPVGSGPFTKITRFTTQDYVFAKNPNYWQAGKPLIPCLEYVQASSNDAALALIQSGQVDWTHNFVPNVEQAYVAKDPTHFHAFYATTAYPVSLMLRRHAVPVQPRRRSARRSAWRSTATRSRSSASTATRRPPTRSASTASSRSGSATRR